MPYSKFPLASALAILAAGGVADARPRAVEASRVVRIRLMPASPLPLPNAAIDWKESRGPKCIPRGAIAAAIVSAPKQVDLVLIGGKRASRAATPEHPFGYGRERYVYAFLVSIILFSVGGVFSIYEGVHKIQHPEPIERPWIPIAVLLIAIRTYRLIFHPEEIHDAKEKTVE